MIPSYIIVQYRLLSTQYIVTCHSIHKVIL